MSSQVPYWYISRIWSEWINGPDRERLYFEKYLDRYGISQMNYGYKHVVKDESKFMIAKIKFSYE